MSRALQGFLGDRLNVAEAGLIIDDARARLQARGVSESAIDGYVACLQECDRQRFSPSETTPDERQAFLDRVLDAMAALEAEVR